MSISLATKGIIVNRVVSLATKGVIWRSPFGEAVLVLLAFRGRVSDIASFVGTVAERETIIGTLTDISADITVSVTSSGIIATLTDHGGYVIINDVKSIRGILNGYNTLITALADRSILNTLVDAGAFSQITDVSYGTKVTDSGGKSGASDL